MATFTCKMCGGALEIADGATVVECAYCGTQQTLPKLNDDRRANMYDRANHFRRNNEFDKAMEIYEQILAEDRTDAEAYWSLILCRYGIEYVEDPATRKRVPTVNRTQFASIFADEDYKSALRYADGYQRTIYEQEAAAINEIQKGILAISSQEEPFDIFICYKETDHNGRRTQDSVLANELYYQLTQEGFKVFFARITLEDKLGTAYEPYIFAALHSAKVMVVIGTKPEFFNAVWVKNEWSRYLALVKQSAGAKTLIPAYRDMDPYDLPAEFSYLQAQDMSKLGFMQDLIRGIRKIIPCEAPKRAEPTTVIASAASAVSPLLERAHMFLEDGAWSDADAYAEKVLDRDPRNGRAYLVKLLAELKLSKEEELARVSFADYTRYVKSANYEKAIRFDEQIAAEFRGYQEETLGALYEQAVQLQAKANCVNDFRDARMQLGALGDFRDAEQRVKECDEQIAALQRKAEEDAIRAREAAREEERKRTVESSYKLALSLMRSAARASDYAVAAERFERIAEWRDASELAARCRSFEKEKRLQEKKTAKILRIVAVAVLAVVILGAVIAGVATSCYRHSPEAQLEWSEAGGGLMITGYDSKYISDHLEIPQTIQGKTVTAIGSEAFSGCTNLVSITIPASVTSIGSSAFHNCMGLTAVHISDLAAWCGIAFSGSDSNPLSYAHHLYLRGQEIKGLVIPQGVTSIGNFAFYGCTGLTSVAISEGVTSIGNSSFYCCTGLTSVTIPEGVTSIGNYAFYNCTGLTSVTIPESVTNIGNYAFNGCTNITEATMSTNAISYIPKDKLKTVVLNGGTSLLASAFKDCTSLESITISDSVTSIGSSAFEGCESLTSVTFANTTGWAISRYNNDVTGSPIAVTHTARNAQWLKTTYYLYYWKRNG